MPNRILRESICRSESIDELDYFEESFFYRLLVNCDDFGRFDGREKILKSSLYPLKDDVELYRINEAVETLDRVGLISIYYIESKRFLQVINWNKYQQVRTKKGKYPAPGSDDSTVCDTSSAIETSRGIPSFEEVKTYCEERKNGIDPKSFYEYYDKLNWELSGTPVRSWKSLVTAWEKKKGFEPVVEETGETKWQS